MSDQRSGPLSNDPPPPPPLTTPPTDAPPEPPPFRPGPPPRPPRPPGPFDPMHPGLMALTIICTVLMVPLIGCMSIFSATSTAADLLDDPVRTFAVLSESDRRMNDALRSVFPERVGSIMLPDPAEELRKVREAWDTLVEDVAPYDDSERAYLARNVIIAGYGDAGARQYVRDESFGIETLPPEIRSRARALASPVDEPPLETIPDGEAFSAAVFVITMSAVFLLMLAVGVVALIVWAVRRRPPVALATEPTAGSFTLGVGYAVFIWSLAVFMLVSLAGEFIALVGLDVQVLVMTLGSVAGVLVIRQSLLRPGGLGVRTALGVPPAGRRWWSLLALILIVFAIDQGFSLLVMGVAWAVGHETPWHFVADDTLLFGSTMDATLLSADVMILGPIFEELAWRGVLFAALRRRMGAWPAALLSGFIFGLAHGYDITGLLVVSFSGVLYAMSYERTRSLAPCVAAHILSNAFAVGSVLPYRIFF